MTNPLLLSLTLCTLTLCTLTLCTLTSAALAGTEVPPPVQTNSGDFNQWLTPSLDLRTRYEFRDVDGLDPSHALTSRARLGLLAGNFNGFSAFAELEATAVLIDDYKSNPVATDTSTFPHVLGNTPIGDPRNFELNQVWLEYNNDDFAAKFGRQRIIRNNAAFIGNVGWRQNEQTYDAVNLAYAGDGFNLSYAYSDRVLRIFGHDANDALPGPPLRDFEGDFHFLDGTASTDFGTVGGYVYLIDVHNNTSVGESNTFGAFLDSGPLHAELAFQSGTTALNDMGDYDALYGHLIYTHKGAGATYSAGLEYLEDYFKTPFATVHAFNGFADAFILQRVGLNDNGGTYNGIADAYLGYVRPGLPWGLTFKGFLHYFMDDNFGDAYGWEADAVLAKKFNDDFSGILKAAYFDADKSNGYTDIKQLSLEVTYTF
jgi:hypothetical protein